MIYPAHITHSEEVSTLSDKPGVQTPLPEFIYRPHATNRKAASPKAEQMTMKEL